MCGHIKMISSKKQTLNKTIEALEALQKLCGTDKDLHVDLLTCFNHADNKHTIELSTIITLLKGIK